MLIIEGVLLYRHSRHPLGQVLEGVLGCNVACKAASVNLASHACCWAEAM